MLSFLDPVRGIDFVSVLLRILLSCICGAVIGLERSYKNRPTGFRTHILVCIGSSTAALTGLYLYIGLAIPSDISRISSQVVSGLGFICAGTIIVTKSLSIRGLTTAAGLWVTGIIGIAIGSGYYELGVLGTIMVLIIELFFSRIGHAIRSGYDYQIIVHYNQKAALDAVLRLCKDLGQDITNLMISHLEEGSDAQHAAAVSLHGNLPSSRLLEEIHAMPGIVSARSE